VLGALASGKGLEPLICRKRLAWEVTCWLHELVLLLIFSNFVTFKSGSIGLPFSDSCVLENPLLTPTACLAPKIIYHRLLRLPYPTPAFLRSPSSCNSKCGGSTFHGKVVEITYKEREPNVYWPFGHANGLFVLHAETPTLLWTCHRSRVLTLKIFNLLTLPKFRQPFYLSPTCDILWMADLVVLDRFIVETSGRYSSIKGCARLLAFPLRYGRHRHRF